MQKWKILPFYTNINIYVQAWECPRHLRESTLAMYLQKLELDSHAVNQIHISKYGKEKWIMVLVQSWYGWPLSHHCSYSWTAREIEVQNRYIIILMTWCQLVRWLTFCTSSQTVTYISYSLAYARIKGRKLSFVTLQ